MGRSIDISQREIEKNQQLERAIDYYSNSSGNTVEEVLLRFGAHSAVKAITLRDIDRRMVELIATPVENEWEVVAQKLILMFLMEQREELEKVVK